MLRMQAALLLDKYQHGAHSCNGSQYNDAGKKSRLPTELGTSIGISTEERQTIQGRFTVVLYNKDAQAFILDNIDAISEPEASG